MGKPSVPDGRVVRAKPPLWGMLAPVTAKDVEEALALTKAKSTPGPDEWALRDLRKAGVKNLTMRCNLLLLLGCSSGRGSEGVTTLIPKIKGSTRPADYQPITNADLA